MAYYDFHLTDLGFSDHSLLSRLEENEFLMGDILSSQLNEKITAIVHEQIDHASQIKSLFRNGVFKSKGATLRIYIKSTSAGHWHTDPGITLTHIFRGSGTLFDGFEHQAGQSVVFNQNVRHGIPPSKMGRMLLLIY